MKSFISNLLIGTLIASASFASTQRNSLCDDASLFDDPGVFIKEYEMSLIGMQLDQKMQSVEPVTTGEHVLYRCEDVSLFDDPDVFAEQFLCIKKNKKSSLDILTSASRVSIQEESQADQE